MLTAGAFSASSLFNLSLAKGLSTANDAVEGYTPLEVAGDEDYWTVIQQAYTVDRNIINLTNGGVSPSPRIVQEAVERYNKMGVGCGRYVVHDKQYRHTIRGNW